MGGAVRIHEGETMSIKNKAVCEICGREFNVDSPSIQGFERYGYHTINNHIEHVAARDATQHICRDCVFNLARAMFALKGWKLGDAVRIFR
jgi:hypothetical protein